MGRARIVILAWILAGCPSTYGESPDTPATPRDGSSDGAPQSGGGGGGSGGDAGDGGPLPCAEGDRREIDPDTGRCYMLFANAVTWPQAELACRDIKANLAAITTPAENTRVASLLTAGAWIGASDAIQDGKFVWASGDDFEFTSWADGEPDGRFRTDCVEIRTDGKWRAEPCTTPRAYVCER